MKYKVYIPHVLIFDGRFPPYEKCIIESRSHSGAAVGENRGQ